jgi:uncharacterized protein (TIGR02466 family)
MNNITEIFPVPIYNAILDIDTDKLIKMSYEEKEKNPKGRYLSNKGGYQTNDLDYNNYKFLFDKIFPHANKYYGLFKINAELFLANFWTNISNHRDFNKAHVHAGCCISGVIYFKTPQRPKCGNIVFEHPFSGIDFFTNGAKVDETTKYNYPAYYWNAEPNLLLLFPSYLRHYVEPNETKEDRISMSFNFGTRW